MTRPTHSHPCQGGCKGRCPCPVRSRDRQQWCDLLAAERLLVCLGCKIKRWMAEGVEQARTEAR